MRTNPIGVFDSGAGGLNVLRECAKLLPDEKFIYLADEANMPYGTKTADEIKRAAISGARTLFDMNCKALVVACNTATVNAVDDIRALYGNRVVVGLEPAVRPCFRELGRNSYAVAIVTKATYESEKFNRLIASCEGRVIPVALPELAKLIEDNINDLGVLRPYIYEVFDRYRDAQSVILGCSHYTYISDIIKDFYNGNVYIYDGAAGEAQRLKYCLALSDLLAPSGNGGSIRFYSTQKSKQPENSDCL